MNPFDLPGPQFLLFYAGLSGVVIHRHDVPDPVYDLLREVGRRAPRPLTVILERDGAYPPVARLLDELDRARAALAEGRRAA